MIFSRWRHTDDNQSIFFVTLVQKYFRNACRKCNSNESKFVSSNLYCAKQNLFLVRFLIKISGLRREIFGSWKYKWAIGSLEATSTSTKASVCRQDQLMQLYFNSWDTLAVLEQAFCLLLLLSSIRNESWTEKLPQKQNSHIIFCLKETRCKRVTMKYLHSSAFALGFEWRSKFSIWLKSKCNKMKMTTSQTMIVKENYGLSPCRWDTYK